MTDGPEKHRPKYERPEGVPQTFRRNRALHHFVMWFHSCEPGFVVIVWRTYNRGTGWFYWCDTTTLESVRNIPYEDR